MHLLFYTTFILITVNSVLSIHPTDVANSILKGVLDGFLRNVAQSKTSTIKIKNGQGAISTMNTTNLFNTINSKVINEMAIVQTLIRDEAEVNELLLNSYEHNHGVSLVVDLRNKLTGPLENLVVAYLTPVEVYLAKEIYNFFHGIGSDEYVLIDSLCIMDSEQKALLKNTYEQFYSRTIEDEILEHTTNKFKKLMHLCTTVERQDSEIIQSHKYHMRSSSIDKHPADVEFLATESFDKIAALTYNHAVRNNIKFKKVIARIYTGDVRRAAIAIVNYSKSPSIYYAERFYQIFRAETHIDYSSLIRLAIRNREADFKIIEDMFKMQYKNSQSLRSLINAKISSEPFKVLFDKLLGSRMYDQHRLDVY